jgi:hypothetical protein
MLMVSLDALKKVSGPIRRFRLRRLSETVVESFVASYGPPSSRDERSFVLWGGDADLALSAITYFTEVNEGRSQLTPDIQRHIERGKAVVSLAAFEVGHVDYDH